MIYPRTDDWGDHTVTVVAACCTYITTSTSCEAPILTGSVIPANRVLPLLPLLQQHLIRQPWKTYTVDCGASVSQRPSIRLCCWLSSNSAAEAAAATAATAVVVHHACIQPYTFLWVQRHVLLPFSPAAVRHCKPSLLVGNHDRTSTLHTCN